MNPAVIVSLQPFVGYQSGFAGSGQLFFDEMDKDTINKSPRRLLNKGAKQEGEVVVSNAVGDPLLDTKNMSIITAFQRIRNPQVAKHLFELIVSMSATVESALPKRKE